MNAQLTILTSGGARLSKKWELVNGDPTKLSGSSPYDGTAKRVVVDSPMALGEILLELNPTQALCFGVAEQELAEITTKKGLVDHPGAIARSNDYFNWPEGGGWLMLDYDPPKGGVAMTKQEWLEALEASCPGILAAPSVWSVSSSSYIFNGGELVTGLQGQRLYIKVMEAADIPRAGRLLFDRSFLAGYGRTEVNKAGRLLRYSIIDAAVWRQSGLDYAGAPMCEPPLHHRRPDPVVMNNEAPAFDTAAILQALTDDEANTLRGIQHQQAAEIADEVAAVRKSYAAELAAKAKIYGEDAQAQMLLAVEHNRLHGDFVLLHSSGKQVTVADVLNNPNQWHGERFADPLEWDYAGGDTRIAYLNLHGAGSATLFSHAHGGALFKLYLSTQSLHIVAGGFPQLLPKITSRLALDGQVYEHGGHLSRVVDDGLLTVERPWLRSYLELVFSLEKYDIRKKEWTPRDCPDDLAARVIAARGEWDLPKISGLIKLPIMRPSGTLLGRQGYDLQTGLLFVSAQELRHTPRPLDKEALRAALVRVWAPFALFPFDSKLSCGVFLSALLTTVCRAALPTAPGFLMRAHSPGSGKSLLSESLMLITGAPMRAMSLPQGNPEEIEKRIFSALITGRAGLTLDNLSGVIDNPALCAFITSPEPEGRILGQSELRSAPNRCLIVLNGNNVTAGGDTFRRILPVTIDPNCENPETRHFSFNPKTVIGQDVEGYRADLLSVLLSYQAAGAPKHGAGAFGSFEEWERVVRQTVCWLIAEDVVPAGMGDPLGVLKVSRDEDPEFQAKIELLGALHALSSEPFTAASVMSIISATAMEKDENVLAIREAIGSLNIKAGDTGALGFFFRANNGVIAGGFRLDKLKARREWRVKKVFSAKKAGK